MPIIKPYDLNKPEIPDELQELLVNAGTAPSKVSDEKASLLKTRDIFNKSGASVDAIAETVANIMNRGESDSGRLKASELALKVHGILQEIDERPVPSIIINVTNQFTQENKTLINLIVPT